MTNALPNSHARLPRDPLRDALVQRIVSSREFEKSARMRDLLVFLCDAACIERDQPLREGEIGTLVFGRKAGYDTAQDPLVRVQISQLRKRLQQYFENEGKNEPLIIEIPRGAYVPNFVARPADVEPSAPVEDVSAQRHKRFYWSPSVWFAAIALVSLCVAAWALLRPRPGVDATAPPTVRQLWAQLLENGHPACVVLSDPGLLAFENSVRCGLTLNEYRTKAFTHVAERQIHDPVARDFAEGLMLLPAAHQADAQLVATLAVLNAGRQIRTDVVPARDFEVGYLRSHNVIMLGSRLSNPWMEMFENQLNFRSVVPDTPDRIYFQNTAPRPGEQPTYHLDWSRQGFCRVAFLPNPSHNGNLLLISGTDMAGTEAGGAFITSEPWVSLLRSTLGLRSDAPFPPFEVLLKVDYLAKNSVPRFSIAGWRIYK